MVLAANTTNAEWQWQFGATSEASEEKDRALELTPGRFCAADFFTFFHCEPGATAWTSGLEGAVENFKQYIN